MSDVVPATSLLGSLKARRQDLARALRKDFRVPRWDNPTLWLRFRPVEHTKISALQKKVDKLPADKKPQAELDGNLDMMAGACVGLLAEIEGRFYEIDDVDHWIEVDPNGEPAAPFTTAVAETLGADSHTARSILRRLFLADGDILMMSGQLVQWSGYGREVDEEELGKSSPESGDQ